MRTSVKKNNSFLEKFFEEKKENIILWRIIIREKQNRSYLSRLSDSTFFICTLLCILVKGRRIVSVLPQ